MSTSHVADRTLFAVQSKGINTSCTTLKTGPGKANTSLLIQGCSTVNLLAVFDAFAVPNCTYVYILIAYSALLM